MIQHTNEIKFKFVEKNIIFREYFDDNFQSIDKIPTQSLRIVLNEMNNVLLVSADKECWGLPGGTVERGESPEQALVKGDDLIYETTHLRYISRVIRIDEFVKDPNCEQQFKKFISIKDIDKGFSWIWIRGIIKK